MAPESKGQRTGRRMIEKGSGILEGEQETRLQDPIFQMLEQLVSGAVGQPLTLTPEIVEMMKANVAGQAQGAFRNQQRETANRFAGSSGTRSGAFAAAQGAGASQFGTGLAQLLRDIDIQARTQRWQDLLNASNLGQSFLGFRSQLPQQQASLLTGAGPSFFNQQSPLQAAGQGIGGILGTVLGVGALPGGFLGLGGGGGGGAGQLQFPLPGTLNV